jgi:carboxypeptidase PM20D1
MRQISFVRILLALSAGATLCVGVLLWRTFTFSPVFYQSAKANKDSDPAIDDSAIARRLAKAITFRTLSTSRNFVPFAQLRSFLYQSFPAIHSKLKHELINGNSLLYEWRGSDAHLPPALFLAHMDVVPAVEKDGQPWKYPPFDGKIADGYVWGRGAIDDKHNLLGVFEAVEWLLQNGFQPKRTLFLAFGHDEEVSGFNGAAQIAATLKSRNIAPEFILDEGGYITDGVVPGVSRPVALIGIAEKGYVTLELTASATPGHSSMPPKFTAIGILAEVITRLEQRPFPRSLKGATHDMLVALAGEMPFLRRMAIANLWLFEPLLLKFLSKAPTGDAAIHTTTAPTIFNAGIKENVLPAQAKATLNFRTLPGDSVQDVLTHVKEAIGPVFSKVVKVDLLPGPRESSATSTTEGTAYKKMAETVRKVFPDTAIAPFLFVGATDSYHYRSLCKDIYRFFPSRFGPDDLHRLHGTDERIKITDYSKAIRFLIEFIRGID